MSEDQRLDSWKEIAAHFGRRVRTVQRWERDEGLPVHRHSHLRRGTVHAMVSELEAWRASRAIAPGEATDADPPARAATPWPRRIGMALAALAAASVLGAAFVQGSIGRRPAAEPASDPEAVLAARYLLHRDTPDAARRAIALCREAIALAPGSAALHECLAHGALVLARSGLVAPREIYPQARAESEQALALEPRRTVALTVRAYVTYAYDWRLADAEREFREAIATASPDPSAAALPYHGLANLLSVMGRHDESIAAVRRAQRLQPLSAALNDDGCWFFYRARRYEDALVEAKRALELEPDRPGAVSCVVDSRRALGDLAGARSAAVGLLASVADPDASRVAALAPAEALDAFDRRLLARVEARREKTKGYFPAMGLAMLHGELGETAESVRWLEKGLALRDPVLLLVRVHPYFDRVRDDPRVLALLQKAGV